MPARTSSFAVVYLLFLASFLAGCSGGMAMSPPPPVFSSLPGTAATEGALYTYQLAATDAAGSMVSFALTQAPAGAVLSGNALSWTPTAAQSRIADNFVVTATTSAGGSATQSWSVTPSGTVHINWVDTHWTATGPTAVPFNWTAEPGVADEVAALVLQPDGSIVTFKGSGNADGTFDIPNVPGGYYWLHMAPIAIYWTSSSTFDFGGDLVGPRVVPLSANENTTFEINVSGLDPLQTGDWFAFMTDLPLLPLAFPEPSLPNSTTLQAGFQIGGNLDFTQIGAAFLAQYEPVSAGSFNGLALGPELTVTNPSFQNGTTNNITGMLTGGANFSVPLSIQGSAWAQLFNAAGPVPAAPLGSVLTVSAQPFVTGRFAMPITTVLGPDLPLVSPVDESGNAFILSSEMSDCTNTSLLGASLVPPNPELYTAQPPIVTDQNFGTVPYKDPFPAAWTRYFSFCEKATVTVPILNSDETNAFLIVDGQNTALPTGMVSPLVSAVQNPAINGASLLTANTINTTPITLNWNTPSGMQPFGYTVQLFVLVTPPSEPSLYVPSAKFGTAATSMTLPVALTAGQEFVLVITALVDGQANMETSPRRSGLPTAYASVVSAPMTMGASTAAQIIHGDARVVPAGRPVDKASDPWKVNIRRIR